MKELENLINQFNSDNLNSLLRAKSRSFRRLDESLSHLNDEQFRDCTMFGEFKVNETELMVVVTAKVNKPLSERSGKKAQYSLGKKFLKDTQRYAGGIFIFYDDKGDFRFSLIYDIPLATGKRDWSNFRRYTYFVSKDQTNKTFIKQIEEADFSSLEKIIEAFSVEKVTKQFYQEIANWYFWALRNVKFPDDAEAEKNGREISVIRLITRLIFIWFMKVRKLVPEDLFDEDTIKEILVDLKPKNDNYYKAILQNLFFATLNTKPEERRFTSKKKGYRGYSQDFGNHNVYRYEEEFKDSEEVIEKYFMPIPFLNGGLFECLDYKSKIKDERKYIDGFTSTKSQQPTVPNFLFFSDDKLAPELNNDYGTTNKKYAVRGIINTLSMYNFTIDESDPNDADVALDPELLGKVFENLLASYNPETAKTARKSTGSYYTPRPIVDYMVDESLKQYFKTHLQVDDIENKLNILFSSEEQENPFDETTTKKIVELIDSLRIVDPAVGSGAFPMRILNRLVFLLHKLDPDNSLWKQSQIEGIKKSVKDPILQRNLIDETERKFKEKNPDYGRKLYLIEKCIYGVDIQQIAVEIAKLRFFISLLVDEKIENGEIEPLPNLDFKLMQGNSLISSFAGIDFTTKPNNDDALFDFDEQYKKLINEFEELKSQYQNEPDVHKKRDLRDKIDAKLLEIFEEKLRQHYPQLRELESKYGKQKEILEAEKKKLFKKIGIDLEQAEQDLIAYTEGRKPKDFFLWDVYFAEVFAEKGGFDIVIGNPPYITYKGKEKVDIKDEQIKLLLEKHPNSAEYKINSYALFIEDGIKFLKDSGILSFIIPSTLLQNEYLKKIRKYLIENTLIYQLVSFSNKVFEAITDSIILISIKTRLHRNETIVKRKEDLNFSIAEEIKVYNQADWRNEAADYVINIKVSDQTNNLLEKIEKNSEFVEDYIEIYVGIVANGIKKFLANVQLNSNYKKYLQGKHIDKYIISPRNLFINFNKERLHSNTDESVYLQREKILVRKTGNKLIAAFDNEKYYTDQSIYNLYPKKGKKINLRFITALLNSDLMDYYFNKKMITNPDIFPYIKGIHLKKLPIKIPKSEKFQDTVIFLVDKILSIKKQNPLVETQHLEDQINIMVYKLYNLTYEEVKIIDPEIERIISKEEYERFEI